ncbi:MAG: magnesium/cobalt transporter CorA [Planctomycetota bacterium]
MARPQRLHKKVGSAPGTVEYLGRAPTEPIRMWVFEYAVDRLEEREPRSVDELLRQRDSSAVTWINVDGVHDVGLLQQLGEGFSIHSLVLEDVANTLQRPKLEDYPEQLFVVARMLSVDGDDERVASEQVALVLGRNYVISFQERRGDVFDGVRERIRHGRGRIRRLGADYLAYALLDAIVDSYFLILERFGDRIERLEEQLLAEPSNETLGQIHHLKRELVALRRSVWPLREVVSGLSRSESPLVKEGTGIFLRDVHDHTVQVIDAIESYRDMVSGLQDLYLSSLSNRMNEVMKVLTIISTIFVPLSFVAGIYGTNFEYIPELGWKWSYFVFWGVMLAATLAMLRFFRKRKWL